MFVLGVVMVIWFLVLWIDVLSDNLNGSEKLHPKDVKKNIKKTLKKRKHSH